LEEVKKKKAAKDKARREALAAAERKELASPEGKNPSYNRKLIIHDAFMCLLSQEVHFRSCVCFIVSAPA